MDSSCRIISIYSNGNVQSRFEYAINLAASLADISKENVLVVDGTRPHKDRAGDFETETRGDGEIARYANAAIYVLSLKDIHKNRI